MTMIAAPFFVIWFALAQNTEEVVLRIEVFGYENVPAKMTQPKPSVLRFVEIVVRDGAPFYCKSAWGSRTLELRGKVEKTKKDEYVVRFSFAHYYHHLRPGERRTDAGSSMLTTSTIAFDKPLEIAGLEAKGASRSKHTYRLTMTKRQIDFQRTDYRR